MLNIVLGILSGGLFTIIVGHLDTADYLAQQWSIWLIEIPFVVLCVVLGRKYGWKHCIIYMVLGVFVSLLLTIHQNSITPVVYLKVAVMGILLGETSWLRASFKHRLLVVSIPGIVFALVFGLPIIFKGVAPDVLERFRQDALEMYETFMTRDEAVNAADNAILMFRGIFKAGLAVFFISAFVFSWLSFLGARWIMPKFKEESEYVAPFHDFKLPFHAIWVFLGGFGLILTEYEPVMPLSLNIFIVMAFLYLVQGIAIVMYHMNRFSLGRFPRVLFWLLFFITLGFSGVFLIFAGVIDNWFNLRSIPSNHNQN